MGADIDCVAVTDHNSGAWIDPLKAAYAQMKAHADAGQPHQSFRELTIFPGVEISVTGGFHLLAIFDPASTTRTITDLLAAIRYRGSDGDSDGVTEEGPVKVITEVLHAGGIPIPAHADRPGNGGKALLALRDGSNGASRLDANTIKGILTECPVLAVEWEDRNRRAPECVKSLVEQLARVLGSDCHSFQGSSAPASRYTWVKMAAPNLEGLRLALLDGNGVSIRRSDEDGFDPFRVPAHFIKAIEIEKASYMGNGQPAKLTFSPFFNAIVGGRGTGKSTVVHALRLAARRDGELDKLPNESEAREQFDAFRKTTRGRDGEGALRNETAIRMEWQHDEEHVRLLWRAEDQGSAVEEEQEGRWRPSSSQSMTADRFPLRIFSQGQIAAMAGTGRQSLLAIIDEASAVGPLRRALEEARRTFFAERARLRELDGKLAQMPEVERKLTEAARKLETLTKTNHSSVLQAFARVQRQQREVDQLFTQLHEGSATIRDAAERILLDEWVAQNFTADDTELLAWRAEVDRLVQRTQEHIEQEAQVMEQAIASLWQDPRLCAWHERAQSARRAHDELQAQLEAQGVGDPQAFARLIQERQQLEAQQEELQKAQADRDILCRQIEEQLDLILQRRREITKKREDFLKRALKRNEHVRIETILFGFDARQIEREFRALIEDEDHFGDDILSFKHGEPAGGIAFELAQASPSEKVQAIEEIKRLLLQVDNGLGGHFRNYLERQSRKPEFADHILAWYPEDDLRIEYQRDGEWHPIREGSQGQRAAALLAFVLAFGEEPIVLDQPEDDLDNHLIYDLVVRQIRENKMRRQLLVVTHNPNIVVNGDAELIYVMEFGRGQCRAQLSGALQEKALRDEVCRVMEGGREAFAQRWKRLGTEV
nr:AAA family ATPase [Methylacidimicrobium tartarophylax]